MIIRELDLIAFGPFTDKTITFDQDSGGLYVIYGRNEAGKSSALRGLKSVLYGISENTQDNFKHANNELRIGIRLCDTAGHELTIIRRKGRKNTLLSPNNETIDELSLAPFLLGASPEIFNTLFGIDHRGLEQGAEEILRQKGEVGQALFSASLGSPVLHTVLEQLENEADSLFRPRGSTQNINVTLKTYEKLKKEIREASLSSQKWSESKRAFTRVSKELSDLQAELTQCRTEVARLERIKRTSPKSARRTELLQQLDDLGSVVVLPKEFSERRQKAVSELDKAQAIEQQTSSRIGDLEEQLEKIEVFPEILTQAETIEAVHEQLGGYRKAMNDRPHIEAERNQLLADVEMLLGDIRPGLSIDDVEMLRPVLNKRVRVSDLGNQRQAHFDLLKQTEENQHVMEVKLEELRNKRQSLPSLVSLDSLKVEISSARKKGDLDSVIKDYQMQLDALDEQCKADLTRLGLWTGKLHDISSLAVPMRESVNRFEEEYVSISQRVQRVDEKKNEIRTAIGDVERELDEIQRTGVILTEAELGEARIERDRGWQLLRRQWVDGENIKKEAEEFDSELALPDAYESKVVTADDMADRLRREADRVHKQANLLARQADLNRQIEESEKQLEECAGDREKLDQDWKALWGTCNIEPKMPKEMRSWLEDFEKLLGKVETLNECQRKMKSAVSDRKTHIQILQQELDTLGKKIDQPTSLLEVLVTRCEDEFEALDEINRKHEQLDNKIEALEGDLKISQSKLESVNKELEEWKTNWEAAMKEFDLASDALPSEVNETLEKLRLLFSKHKEAEQLSIRIHGIDEDAGQFRANVQELVVRIKPELADRSIEQAMADLNVLLTKTRETESRRQQIEAQIEQAKQESQEATTTINTMKGRLDTLCVDAQCGSADRLGDAERRSTEYQKLKSEISNLEQDILDLGEGIALEDLIKEVEGVDPDTTSAKIKEVTEKIESELEGRYTELAEEKGRRQKELEIMDGSDTAAALADEAQSVLARIRQDAERYTRLKLAARFLRQEIESYRDKNQGPLIKRSSEHFNLLTKGSFESLRTDFNEKDEPILVGIRNDGSIVHVEGMSDGARDQLYLSLRLASLEKFMEDSEPMPFIVDDVLVGFDDERSEAALKLFTKLAKKTQVIVFTHHSKVVDQVRTIDNKIVVHEL